MEREERREGWLAWCEHNGIFVAHSRELVGELVKVLSSLPQPVIEIASGSGDFAAAFAEAGIDIIATDVGREGGNVLRLDAESALRNLAPATVLTSFAPIDADIERKILDWPSVRNYLYIGPLINERPGPEALWQHRGWEARDLPRVERYLISRLDFLSDFTGSTHRKRAGAVMLEREDRDQH